MLHPERVGQTKGRVDPSIAILDGLGLLLFIIPGAIAFAVDFSNGTIYLPGTQSGIPNDQAEGGEYLAITPDSEHLTERDIEVALQAHLGRSIDLTASEVQVLRLDSMHMSESAR